MVDSTMPVSADSDNVNTPTGYRVARGDRFPVSSSDASLIKGMIRRGDVQSDIAAYFGCNSGRISEINTGKLFPEVSEAPANRLPPAGPYMIGRAAVRARETLLALGELIAEALSDIDGFEGGAG